ncbi:MAG: ribosome maturation factor RimP [Alphaproteobacteria bacterium]
MELNHKIEEIISPVLENLGYELVRVQLLGTVRQTLQIMAERKDEQAMAIEDCTAISRAISPILDVEDPISSSYSLEVSSPGVNRPLTKPVDFVRFKGLNVKVETKSFIEKRKKFNGILKDFTEDNTVVIAIEEEIFNIPYEDIRSAKLAIADNLLKKQPKK